MARPPVLPVFGTAQTNQTVPSGGLQSAGYADGAIPTAKNLNYLLNLIYLWIAWLFGSVATISRTKYPAPFYPGTTWTSVNTYDGSPNKYLVISAAGSSKMLVDLDVPQGYKISTLALAYHTLGGFASTITLTVEQNPTTFATALTTAATLATTLGASASGDIQMNMLATSGALASVTVAAAGGTYTRSAGSFITDGFFVGQIVQWTGFSNGGNNALKTITALSATVMTVSNTGLVNETVAATANASGVSPTSDATFGMVLGVSCPVAGIGVWNLRYTMVPQ